MQIAHASKAPVSVQHIVPHSRGRGHPPTVDLYVGGEFKVFIELIRNGNKVDQHHQRFLKGSYSEALQAGKQYIVLDIELEKVKPRSTQYKEQLTYVHNSRTLYQGDVSVLENLNENICAADIIFKSSNT